MSYSGAGGRPAAARGGVAASIVLLVVEASAPWPKSGSSRRSSSQSMSVGEATAGRTS